MKSSMKPEATIESDQIFFFFFFFTGLKQNKTQYLFGSFVIDP